MLEDYKTTAVKLQVLVYLLQLCYCNFIANMLKKERKNMAKVYSRELKFAISFRWILTIALHIPTGHDFRVIIARALMHVHNDRNFPQAKLDSETNARFHGSLYLFA